MQPNFSFALLRIYDLIPRLFRPIVSNVEKSDQQGLGRNRYRHILSFIVYCLHFITFLAISYIFYGLAMHFLRCKAYRESESIILERQFRSIIDLRLTKNSYITILE